MAVDVFEDYSRLQKDNERLLNVLKNIEMYLVPKGQWARHFNSHELNSVFTDVVNMARKGIHNQ